MKQCHTTEPIYLSIPTTGIGDEAMSHDRAHTSSMPSTGVGDGAMSHDRAHTSPYQPQVWAMEQCRTTEPIPLPCHPQVWAMEQCRTTEPMTLPCHTQVWSMKQCRTTEPVPLLAIHRCGRWSNVARQSPYLSIPTTGVGDGAMSHDRAHTSPYQPQVWAMGQCRTTEPIPLHAIHRYGRRSNVTRQSPYLSMPSTGVGDGAMSHDRAHTNHRCGRWSNVARQSPYLSMPSTGVGDGAMSHDRAHTSPYQPQVWAMEQCRTTEPIPLHTNHRCGRWSNVTRQSPYLFHAIHRCGRWSNAARQSPYLSIPTTGVGDGAMSHDRAHTSPCHPQVWAMKQCHMTEPIPLPCHPQVWAMEQCRTTEPMPIPFHPQVWAMEQCHMTEPIPLPCHPQVWAMEQCRTTEPIPIPFHPQVWAMEQCHMTESIPLHAIHRCGQRSNVT